MFVLLCLALVAAVQATPTGKVIPVFEDAADLRHHSDPRLVHRTLCFDDCHHHVLNKPTFVVRSTQGAHTVHFAPIGLNGLAKSPLTMPLHEAILSPEANVVAIFPFARFPFELFPGLLDSELVVPEHSARLSHFYKEAPIVAVFPEEEFRKINEHQGLIKVADLSVDPTGFSVAKDHALLNRNAALGAPLSAAPAFAAHDVTPAVAHAVQPLTFTPAAKGAVYSVPQYTGAGIGVGGGIQKYIPYTPTSVPTTYYTTVPIY